MARPRGIEPLTKNLEVSLNILLSQYNFIKFINFLASYIPTKNQSYFHLRSFRGAKLEQKILLEPSLLNMEDAGGRAIGITAFWKQMLRKAKKRAYGPFFLSS